MVLQLHYVDLVPGMAKSHQKLFKLCCVHFQHGNLSKPIETYHQFRSWTTAL